MFFRKRRRTNSGLPSDSQQDSIGRNSTPRSRTSFSLAKTFSRTAVDRSGDCVDDPKGPLGLNLLHSPAEPHIDLIFVHGLGGGSRKTWSKTPSIWHYWPQEWLREDPAFKNVRIHSYGYDSDYLKGREDCLNIHHIGKSFLGALGTSPYVSTNSRTIIIAVGHSMGGLVIKKAYILASQDAAYKTLAGRFAAIYFLATPHRGADSANTLKNILKVAYDRAYIADLERNSGAVQVINDEFRHFSADLELWSFYETQNMRLWSSPVVDPESAILGYREERQMPMNADHRSICKFDTPADPNYKTLRDCLAATVGSIEARMPELQIKERRDQKRDLKRYLEVSDIVDEDYVNVKQARMHDSCQWITEKPDYRQWREGESTNDRLLWVKGKPATGKSVLAGYVIELLQESGHDCSYFFFKHGDRSKSSLSRCLRTLAYQMAVTCTEAGNAILELRDDGLRLDHVDDRTLWRILFLSGIFQTPMRRHYWVIDALDECSSSTFFDSMLSGIGASVPLRILVTSRDAVDAAEKGSLDSNPGIVRSFSISITDTLPDLRLLIERKTKSLGVVWPDDRGALAERILVKSRGSFLWTILVLEELVRCHSKNEVDRVLEDVPRGMEPLYMRTLNSMAQAPRGKTLAKAILMWAACAVRPLTTNELNGALTTELQDSFPRLEESISALCGHLVFVDKFGKVQMVHETAREFLLSVGTASEFATDRTTAHTRMAQVCITCILGNKKKPLSNRHRSSSKQTTVSGGAEFARYAQAAYSYHLSKASPTAPQLFHLVEQFSKSAILAWIEAIAVSQDLNQLIRTSKHLKTYANACAAERSPLDPLIRSLRQWSTDLARIPAMFANALTRSPSSIYSLVPPFCPTGSMIYDISRQARKLTVLGALRENWDDRVTCIDFPQSQPSVLCYGEQFLAVGQRSGLVTLYHMTSYQEYKILDHGESVKLLSFSNKKGLVATCGMKKVKVWDILKGEPIHILDCPPGPLDMEFDGDALLIASRKNYLVFWDMQEAHPETIQTCWSDTSGPTRTPPRGAPCALAISVSHGLLAVAYSGQPITLWDLHEDAYAGSCGKKLSTGKTSTHVVVALAFNPNPSIALLAVAYLDGDLTLLDPFSGQQLECFRADCQTLAPSPNGRLLAAGGAGGIIHIYEFDTLKVLYRVKASNSYIKQLSFAPDSLVLADIRRTQCTVWEPEALLRDSLSDESSGIVTSSPGLVVDTVSLDAKAKIVSIEVDSGGDSVFCGKDNGDVVLYDRKTAACIRALFRHKSSVRHLAWCRQSGSLLSVDASNRIFLHSISGKELQDMTPVLELRLETEQAIVGLLVGEMAGKFIVSTRESDHVFSLTTGEQENDLFITDSSNFSGKWIAHPSSDLYAIRVDSTEVRVFRWDGWLEVKRHSLALGQDPGRILKNAIFSPPLNGGPRLMLEFSDPHGSSRTGAIMIFDAACLAVGENKEETSSMETEFQKVAIADEAATSTDEISQSMRPLSSRLATLSPNIAHVFGIDNSGNLAFLDRSSWVCSSSIRAGGLRGDYGGNSSAGVNGHFFIPYDWFAGSRDIVCAMTQGDLVLTRGGDLVVIRDGFEHVERVAIE